MSFVLSQSVDIAAVAVLGALVHFVLGVRALRCKTASALSRFSVASVELAIGVLVFFAAISPVIGYGLLCLAIASVFLFDLLQDERTPRRRVASLTPRPAADVVPASWVAIAVLSPVMLAPYVVLDEQRAAALMVGVCVLVMAGIAWRIASAPMRLEGEDIQSERICDAASRSLKVGLTAVVAIGSIFVFICFVNANLAAVSPLQQNLLCVSSLTWAVMLAWVALYGRLLHGHTYSES
jgi:hypothetical protein